MTRAERARLERAHARAQRWTRRYAVLFGAATVAAVGAWAVGTLVPALADDLHPWAWRAGALAVAAFFAVVRQDGIAEETAARLNPHHGATPTTGPIAQIGATA